MVYNQLKIAIRNILRNRLYSFINIIGLGVTLAAIYILFIYVNYELSFDNFQRDQVYRVNLITKKDNEVVTSDSRTPLVLGKLLKEEIANVEHFTRVPLFGETIISYENQNVRERNALVTDPSHFDVLKYNIVQGDVKKALKEPFSVMISTSLSKKLFGDRDPLNQTIQLNNGNLDGSLDFRITAIFEDQPTNSHLRPHLLLSYATVLNLIGQHIDDSWYWNNLYTYVRLNAHADPDLVANQTNDLVQKYFGENLKKMGVNWSFDLQPVDKIYIEEAHVFEFDKGGNKKLVQYLSMAGMFMLLVAYVNFVNLFTAQSSGRLKEIAIRKINGAKVGHIISQFVLEAVIINAMALLVAFTMVQVFLGSIIDYFEFPPIQSGAFTNWIWLAIISFIVALPAGVYPAFLVSSFQPVISLKGTKNIRVKGVLLKKILVVFQFAASLILIYGTMVIYNQLSFARSYDVGFSTTNRLIVKSPMVSVEDNRIPLKPLKETLLNIATVEKVATLDEIPGNEIYWRAMDYECSNGTKLYKPSVLVVGEDYFDLFDIDSLAGRSFKYEVDSFLSGVILNRTATKALGIDHPGSAVGKSLTIDGHTLPVIGVVEDYFQQSLKTPIKPIVFHFRKNRLHYIALTLDQRHDHSSIDVIGNAYKKMFPTSPFEYYYLDEFYNKQYLPDLMFGKLFRSFAFLVIFVASMGIFALSLLGVSQRTKEVGIRKILGASLLSVLKLLTREYLLLIVFASVAGLPLGYFIMDNWLKNFTYKITPGWWMIIFPAIVMAIVILIAIGYNAIKVAINKPVNAIRHE